MTKHKDDKRQDDGEVIERDTRDSPTQFAASGLTVPAANPTPPTNIGCVSTGSPPVTGVVFNQPNTPPTKSGDAALFPAAGQSPVGGPASPIPAGAAAITAIQAPLGGTGGNPIAGLVPPNVIQAPQVLAEASGSVVINNTNPLAVSISTMGAYTTTPNASHPSGQAPATPPTITSLAPASTPGTGGTMLLTVTGTGFQQNSIVAVGGVNQTTNFVSATTLEAPNAPKRSSAGTSPVTVVTNGVATAATNWTFT